MSRYLGTFTVQPRYKGDLVMDKLFIGNDVIVKIENLKEDVFGGVFLNNATAEFTVFDTTGTTLSGVTFPISMSYATDSPGIYEGTLDAEDLSLSEGTKYDIKVTVDSGGDQVARWFRRLIAVQRRV